MSKKGRKKINIGNINIKIYKNFTKISTGNKKIKIKLKSYFYFFFY